MSLAQRLRRFFAPPPPAARFMCIRCDKVKPDVLHAAGRCAECERIVLEVALDYPDVYREYLERRRESTRKYR